MRPIKICVAAIAGLMLTAGVAAATPGTDFTRNVTKKAPPETTPPNFKKATCVCVGGTDDGRAGVLLSAPAPYSADFQFLQVTCQTVLFPINPADPVYADSYDLAPCSSSWLPMPDK